MRCQPGKKKIISGKPLGNRMVRSDSFLRVAKVMTFLSWVITYWGDSLLYIFYWLFLVSTCRCRQKYCLFYDRERVGVKSCPTLCNPADYSPPGSSVRGIFQTRILEWGAVSFSRGKWKLLSCVWLFATPWTIQSTEFSRPEYWSGSPLPSPGDLSNPGIEPRSTSLWTDSLPAGPQGKLLWPGYASNISSTKKHIPWQTLPIHRNNWFYYLYHYSEAISLRNSCHAYMKTQSWLLRYIHALKQQWVYDFIFPLSRMCLFMNQRDEDVDPVAVRKISLSKIQMQTV